MHFASPFVLWLTPLVVAALAIGLWVSTVLRRKRLSAFLEKSFHPAHVDPGLGRIRAVKDTALVLAVLCLLLALARPQWGRREGETVRRGQDVVVAVDVSLSMLAEDLRPNRLEKAKYELAAFIDGLKGDRIGIVAFAGKAFLQCPLTLDYEAAKMYLGILDPASIPVPGTALAEAIRVGTQAFDRSEFKHKVMILLTDGEDHEGKAQEAAREAAKNGVIIHVIGIGSATGEPIPLRDGSGRLTGYKKDKSGRVVTTRLNDGELRKIALMGGGKYYPASPGRQEIRRILEDIDRMDKKTHSSVRLSRYQDRFAWFLVPGLLLFLFDSVRPERSWRRRRRRE